jgi:foldase protein PrsA
MRKIILLSALALLLGACAGGDDGIARAAVVDGEVIPNSQIQHALDDFEQSAAFEQLSQQNGKSKARRLFEQSYLSQLIRREVLGPEAKDLGVEVSDDDVTARIGQIEAQVQASGQTLEKALADQGLTQDQLREFVYFQVLEEKLRTEVTSDVAPTGDELKEFYHDNPEQFREVRVSHILLKKDPQKIEELRKKLVAAPKASQDELFASLAKKFSEDGSASKGGDLGWATPTSYVPPFADAVNRLEVGEISDVVKTEFGFHVILLQDRRQRSFADAKQEIEQQIGTGKADEAWQSFLLEAYKSADIDVNSRFGELDLQTQQVVDPDAADVPGAEE